MDKDAALQTLISAGETFNVLTLTSFAPTQTYQVHFSTYAFSLFLHSTDALTGVSASDDPEGKTRMRHRVASGRGKVGQQVWRSGGVSEDQGSVKLLRCRHGGSLWLIGRHHVLSAVFRLVVSLLAVCTKPGPSRSDLP